MIIIKNFEKLAFFISIVLLLSVFSGCIGSDEDVGEDFVFTSLNGEIKHLRDYRGKVVVLDLMRVIGCDPCLYQFLELKKISENYSNSDVVILSIDVNIYESAKDIQTMIDKFKQQLNIELDWVFGMDNGIIWEKYHINEPGGVPTLYIFDKNGKIYYSNEGYEPYSKLSSKIDELLKKD
ncbi:MAG: TlpA disulfide reductase family protein [Candidatus Thermoplasmatota archaeon]|nr:TlpA disulfide reductase family protein [Candidatus Thermoplasmatota archaeon]